MANLPTAYASQTFGRKALDFYVASGDVNGTDPRARADERRLTDIEGAKHTVRLVDRDFALEPGDQASVLRLQSGPARRSRPVAVVNHTRDAWGRTHPGASALLSRTGIARNVNWLLTMALFALASMVLVWPYLRTFLMELDPVLFGATPEFNVLTLALGALPDLGTWSFSEAVAPLSGLIVSAWPAAANFADSIIFLGGTTLGGLTVFAVRSWRLLWAPLYVGVVTIAALALGGLEGAAGYALSAFGLTALVFVIGGLINRVRDAARLEGRIALLADHVLRHAVEEGVIRSDADDEPADAQTEADEDAEADGPEDDAVEDGEEPDDSAPGSEQDAEDETATDQASSDSLSGTGAAVATAAALSENDDDQAEDATDAAEDETDDAADPVDAEADEPESETAEVVEALDTEESVEASENASGDLSEGDSDEEAEVISDADQEADDEAQGEAEAADAGTDADAMAPESAEASEAEPADLSEGAADDSAETVIEADADADVETASEADDETGDEADPDADLEEEAEASDETRADTEEGDVEIGGIDAEETERLKNDPRYAARAIVLPSPPPMPSEADAEVEGDVETQPEADLDADPESEPASDDGSKGADEDADTSEPDVTEGDSEDEASDDPIQEGEASSEETTASEAVSANPKSSETRALRPAQPLSTDNVVPIFSAPTPPAPPAPPVPAPKGDGDVD